MLEKRKEMLFIWHSITGNERIFLCVDNIMSSKRWTAILSAFKYAIGRTRFYFIPKQKTDHSYFLLDSSLETRNIKLQTISGKCSIQLLVSFFLYIYLVLLCLFISISILRKNNTLHFFQQNSITQIISRHSLFSGYY